MPSISICIWRGDNKISDELPKQRPLRYMSDGRVGVVYDGVVRPLRGLNAVDIEDEWERRDDCPLVPPKDADDAKRPWYLDKSGRTTYLAWRGRRSQVDQVINALREDGIGIKEPAPSKRRASNTIMYDWYARIPEAEELSDDDLAETLNPVFQNDDEPEEDEDLIEPAPDEVTISSEEFDRLTRPFMNT